MAAWFETFRFAGLLTMRVSDLAPCDGLILRSLPQRSSRGMCGTGGGPSSFEARIRSLLWMTGETVVRVNVILRRLLGSRLEG
jgi:hypothetical protein